MADLRDDCPVTAYCAPGRKTAAALALTLRGERYGELIEHPWLEGRTDVLLVTEPPWPLLDEPAHPG